MMHLPGRTRRLQLHIGMHSSRVCLSQVQPTSCGTSATLPTACQHAQLYHIHIPSSPSNVQSGYSLSCRLILAKFRSLIYSSTGNLSN